MKSYHFNRSQRNYSLLHELCSLSACKLVNILFSFTIYTAFTCAANRELNSLQFLPQNVFNKSTKNWSKDYGYRSKASSDDNNYYLTNSTKSHFVYQQVDNVITNNQSIELDYCDLAFISKFIILIFLFILQLIKNCL